MPSVASARASTAVCRAWPSSMRGVMSLKEMPCRGKSGTVWICFCSSLQRLLSRARGLSRGERVQHVRHHQLLYARVDGLAVHGCHDAAEVAGLNRVLRHLQGHARDLCVALRELATASDHPYADQLF